MQNKSHHDNRATQEQIFRRHLSQGLLLIFYIFAMFNWTSSPKIIAGEFEYSPSMQILMSEGCSPLFEGISKCSVTFGGAA